VRSSSSALDLIFPLPPRMSVIMNFDDRGGCKTAIDRWTGTVMPPPVISEMELILAARYGLSQPNVFHCSTILDIFKRTGRKRGIRFFSVAVLISY
jgi:hypothetical protein